MPILRVDYDGKQIKSSQVEIISEAVRNIVAEVTGIEDVFVYGNDSQIKIKVAPIEMFVEMSDYKIKDIDELMSAIKVRVVEWKTQNNFTVSINLTIIPMHWKVEVGI
ncbi:MAG: hypothetical protein KBD66_01605 [Candidatus Doudnabacteria bacterium]|nr:hypothetical protein [Candidatus Doudnabacteria bacterium]